MATNYTQHYHLPQWAADDHVLRDEFNQAWADVDAGLGSAYRPGNLPYVIGSYTGNGAAQYDSGQLIELGFRPSFVIITRGWVGNSGPGGNFLAIGQSRGDTQNRVYELSDSGFIVKNYTGGALMLNETGKIYDFIAFR